MEKYTFYFILLFLNFSSEVVSRDKVTDYLGTKTPYRFISNKNDSVIKYRGCKAKKVWMMIRHGTRLPSQEDIQAMNTTLREVRNDILIQYELEKGQLTSEDAVRFEEWRYKVDIDRNKYLTLEGQQEMVLLAERMQKRFPSLLKSKYDSEKFLFRYTATERTQQSARYFANGLFDRDAKDVLFAPAVQVDPVLRFYKHCDKWQKLVKKSPNTYAEQKAFGLSQTMNNTLELVSQKLGLDYVLNLDTVSKMYKVCGYETAWNKHFPSPWCAAFDPETAQVMEYYFDLKHYWMDGYGYQLSYKQACMAVKDLFDNLSTNNNPKAVFYFAHSGTLLKILTHLGLYKPKAHLKATPYSKDRTWRCSKIDCFASNIAFILFGCKDKDHVLAMHQEHIIKMPMCDSELCPLKTLTDHFADSIHNCDYDNMCSMDSK